MVPRTACSIQRSGPGSRRIGMAGRRFRLAVVLLAAALLGISIARSLLPAQDGLKFIRIARQFQNDPWPDVVHGTDQHPLYPALIAAIKPLFTRFAKNSLVSVPFSLKTELTPTALDTNGSEDRSGRLSSHHSVPC